MCRVDRPSIVFDTLLLMLVVCHPRYWFEVIILPPASPNWMEFMGSYRVVCSVVSQSIVAS
jgi:hypothetical protein